MKWLTITLVAATACAMRPQDVLVERPQGDDDNTAADADLANPSLCTLANAVLCDGFETTPVLSPPWFFINKASVTTLDTSRAYRGDQSIHFETNVQSDSEGVRHAELTETAALPLPEFYVRAFMYMPSPAPEHDPRFMGLLQTDAPNDGPQVYMHGGAVELVAPGGTTTAASPLPLDQWVCFEWYVKVDAAAGSMRAWINETELPELAFSGNTDESNGLGRFSFGLAFFGQPVDQPIFDIWYDEIVLDSARVGCER